MSSPDRRLTFEPGLRPVVAVLLFLGVVAIVSNAGRRALLGSSPPAHVEILWMTPFFAVLALVTRRALRHDGVTLADVGLGRETFAPGVLAFASFWACVSLTGVGYLVLTGATGGIGYPFEMEWYWFLVWFTLTLSANGLVEEFVLRGYVQSKCVAVVRRHSRLPAVATGILLASTAFGLLHIPTALVMERAPPTAIPWVVLSNLVPGVLFGIIYYLTQNLWFVGFAHGFANVWPVPFESSAVPGFQVVLVLALAGVTAGYWYWGTKTKRIAVRVEKNVSKPA